MGKDLDLDFKSPAEEAVAVLLGWDATFLCAAPALDAETPSVRGQVTIGLDAQDASEVIVALDCPHRDAQAAAQALLGAEDEQLPPEDMADAVGELVNIIGGNIKGLIDGAVRLSIPSVQLIRSWGQLEADLPGQPVCQLWMEHQGHHLRITVLAPAGTNKGETA